MFNSGVYFHFVFITVFTPKFYVRPHPIRTRSKNSYSFFNFSIDIYVRICYYNIRKEVSNGEEKEKAPESVGDNKNNRSDTCRHHNDSFHNPTNAQGLREWGGKPPLPPNSIPHCKNMSKKKFDNFALYLLFFANFVYAVNNGFNWLFCVSAFLTGLSLILDIVEVFRGRKK